MNIETLQKKRHELGRYDLTHTEIYELKDGAKKGGIDKWLDLIILSYTYGFIRGGNAERNKRKRGFAAGVHSTREAVRDE